MGLVEIFTNASTYQLAGAGVGLAAAGLGHYFLAGVSKGAAAMADMASVGVELLATMGRVDLGKPSAPPPPTRWENFRDGAAGLALATAFYGAFAVGGFVAGTGVESLTTKNTVQNPVQNQQILRQDIAPR